MAASFPTVLVILSSPNYLDRHSTTKYRAEYQGSKKSINLLK